MKNLFLILSLTLGVYTSVCSQTTVSSQATAKQPLTFQKFNSLLRVMKDQPNDSGKYAVLKDALEVNSNYFTIFQLGKLLSMITLESDRLTLAKKSITHVLEEANISSLYDLFSVDANKDELENYVNSVKPQILQNK